MQEDCKKIVGIVQFCILIEFALSTDGELELLKSYYHDLEIDRP